MEPVSIGSCQLLPKWRISDGNIFLRAFPSSGHSNKKPGKLAWFFE
jgi:hypothetical protein